jgi:hypothetical protein
MNSNQNKNLDKNAITEIIINTNVLSKNLNNSNNNADEDINI